MQLKYCSFLIPLLAVVFEPVQTFQCIDPDKQLFSNLWANGLLDVKKKTSRFFQNDDIFNNFTCEYLPPSDTVPTSVHKLRPGDIKIVAALGDSLTAANGADASTIIGVANNYRGLSWSIGGYYKPLLSKNANDDVEEHFSLPNALKRYNPDIKGFAEGEEGPGEEGANLDMAVQGSKAVNLTDQANNLIEELKSNPDYDFENDWKLLTILIGGNNLCQYCVDERSTPDNFAADVQAVLDLLQASVPRMLVNLVTIFNINVVAALGMDDLVCKAAHECFCYCAMLDDAYSQLTLQRFNGLYRGNLHNIINSGRYDTTEDFTVVIQPFLENTSPPFNAAGTEPDLSYFAPDCFHFSSKGHNYAGQALWNNMFQPIGKKNQAWKLGEELDCPSEENPYIFTSQNSADL